MTDGVQGEVGIGLPNTLDGAGSDIAAWAERAEDRGFGYVATIDRIVYPSTDSLLSLAVAAGATSQIGLLTDILLAPAYPPLWLAKGDRQPGGDVQRSAHARTGRRRAARRLRGDGTAILATRGADGPDPRPDAAVVGG